MEVESNTSALTTGLCRKSLLLRFLHQWQYDPTAFPPDNPAYRSLWLDSKGALIEATTHIKECRSVEGALRPGSLYIIDGAMAGSSYFRYRAANQRFELSFPPRFTVCLFLPKATDPPFPVDAILPCPYSEIPLRLDCREYLTDIIGRVVAISPHISKTSNFVTTQHRTLLLENGSNNMVQIQLQSTISTRLDEAFLPAVEDAGPVIVAITGTLISRKRSSIFAQTTAASRLLINEPLPEFQTLKERFSDSNYPIYLLPLSGNCLPTLARGNLPPRTTIAEWLDLRAYGDVDIETVRRLQVTILDINKDVPWFATTYGQSNDLQTDNPTESSGPSHPNKSVPPPPTYRYTMELILHDSAVTYPFKFSHTATFALMKCPPESFICDPIGDDGHLATQFDLSIRALLNRKFTVLAKELPLHTTTKPVFEVISVWHASVYFL